jgi:hypothetical protein
MAGSQAGEGLILYRAAALAMLHRKPQKANYKYFSGHRNKEVFERYKTCRLLVHRPP